MQVGANSAPYFAVADRDNYHEYQRLLGKRSELQERKADAEYQMSELPPPGAAFACLCSLFLFVWTECIVCTSRRAAVSAWLADRTDSDRERFDFLQGKLESLRSQISFLNSQVHCLSARDLDVKLIN